MKEPVIFSLGGSLIVPDHIDAEFLSEFKSIVTDNIDDYKQFIVVTGGGMTARRYQQAAEHVNDPVEDDLDWLGIHASRLNGHLMRTIFKKYADPVMITSPEKMTPRDAKILIGAGYRPGNSTDYVATLFAREYGIKTIVNLSNIDHVYDKDPSKFDDAKPLNEISWDDFQDLGKSEWHPGMNAPFDPVATELAKELGLKVIVMRGTNLSNLRGFLENGKFSGTTIGDE